MPKLCYYRFIKLVNMEGLRSIELEMLPSHLFRSHVEYFLLWFYMHGGKGAFRHAARSRQRQLRRSGPLTVMGYTGYRLGPSRYRSTSSTGPGLWWRLYDARGNHRGRAVRHNQPFRLTYRGCARAATIYDRVIAFLDGLTSDLRARS